MIHAFVACGENSDRTWFWSPAQVKQLFGDGYEALVEGVRQGKPIPVFENLLGSSFQTVSPDSYVAVRAAPTGEETRVPEAGVINMSDYAAKFEAAVEARDRAVDRQSITAFDAAAHAGVASVEAFFNWQAAAWDHFHPHSPIVRTRRHMSLDEKIKHWLPVLATGSSLDYKQIVWDDFFAFKKLRNRGTHSSSGVAAVSLEELAQRLNLFCTGIAVPFMQLHQVFHERIPSSIIRAAYAPAIFVESDESAA